MRKNHLLYVACAIVLIGLICVLPAAATATEKIVFSSTRDGSPGLYAINPDGTGLVRLPDNTSYKNGPGWSPDGSRVAFEFNQNLSSQAIAVMNADGTGQTILTHQRSMRDYYPAWSPDGSRIAFTTLHYGDKYGRSIAVMNADGTNLTYVSNGTAIDGAPVWSPDGSMIAVESFRFVEMPEGNRQIYVVKPDGTGLTYLTPTTEKASGPLWSLDGTRIAFSSDQNGLSEVNVDGTGETTLTENTYYYPDREWSLDRSQITFTSQTQGDSYPALYVMNADGTGKIRLTDNASDPGWAIANTAGSPPIASFTADITSGKAPLTVQFTDTSSEAPTQWAWTFGDGATSTERNPVHIYTVAGTYTVGLTVTSAAGSNTTSKAGLVRATGDTTPPIITNLDASHNPVAINKQVVLTATVNDKKAGRSGIASADYCLDSTGWLPMKARDGSFGEKSEQLTITLPGFASAGVHTFKVRATDTAGNTGESKEILSLTVYNPNSGSVTGDGWIVSPKGAYISDRSKTGKATFDFDAKDQKGVPRGQTEFQFKSAGFTFRSNKVDSLVVTGSWAQFKGVGTVNGRGSYAFIVTTTDGGMGGRGADKFRIKIWDQRTGATIYDNQLNAPDTSAPTTVIGGGSIVISR